jgi:hypothetical protein
VKTLLYTKSGRPFYKLPHPIPKLPLRFFRLGGGVYRDRIQLPSKDPGENSRFFLRKLDRLDGFLTSDESTKGVRVVCGEGTWLNGIDLTGDDSSTSFRIF